MSAAAVVVCKYGPQRRRTREPNAVRKNFELYMRLESS
jgi:hypothetical protein